MGLEAAIARAQADSARTPWTEADARFMTSMIGHHAQAVEMSRMAPTHGASAQIRTLAARIINAQEDEIRAMQTWLRERRRPVPDPLGIPATAGAAADPHAGHAGMGHGASHAGMPGMLTPEQMKQLDAARGPAFDELFLVLMIQHHEGATAMVKELFDSPGAANNDAVFKFASDVNADQSTEIQRMKTMLFLMRNTSK